MSVQCPWLPSSSQPPASDWIELHPEILRACPDACEAVLLQGGAVNRCFRVRTQTEVFAVRLGVADPGKYGFDRVQELAFYGEAERRGLAPPLKASDPSKGVLVMQFIDGKVVSEETIRQPGVLPKIVELVHALHAVESPEKGDGKTIDHIRFFMGKLKEHNALSREWEAVVTHAIEEMPVASSLVLCHNDLAFNLMEDKIGTLWAIDFECAGWNHPAFDLAFLCIWYKFSEQEKTDLLEAYAGDISLQQLNAAIRLGLLFSALWSRLEVVYGNKAYETQAEELFQKAAVQNVQSPVQSN